MDIFIQRFIDQNEKGKKSRMAKIAENDYLSMHNRAGSSIEHGSSIDQGSAERKSQLSVNLSIN